MKVFIMSSLILMTIIDSSAQSKKTEQATFGMGCFWCSEAVFQRIKGVSHVQSGYEGGTIPNPTYEQVCRGNTNHAEVITFQFDPSAISYGELLEIFWKLHDPTTPNRQGADVGTQYRSVIFYHNELQKITAEKFKALLNREKAFDKPIVTIIEPAQPFYPAENYHQDYYILNKEQPYCRAVIRPKMEKLDKVFKDYLTK